METTASPAPSSSVSAVERSPWHSPVPYLFGGLAAMLGLIAFALLILACSYWKLSGFLGDNADNQGGDADDIESAGGDGASKPGDDKPVAQPVLEERFLVIMAGQEKPTFLATPMASRTTSFGSSSCRSTTSVTTASSSGESSVAELDVEMGAVGGGGGDRDQVLVIKENRES